MKTHFVLLAIVLLGLAASTQGFESMSFRFGKETIDLESAYLDTSVRAPTVDGDATLEGSDVCNLNGDYPQMIDGDMFNSYDEATEGDACSSDGEIIVRKRSVEQEQEEGPLELDALQNFVGRNVEQAAEAENVQSTAARPPASSSKSDPSMCLDPNQYPMGAQLVLRTDVQSALFYDAGGWFNSLDSGQRVHVLGINSVNSLAPYAPAAIGVLSICDSATCTSNKLSAYVGYYTYGPNFVNMGNSVTYTSLAFPSGSPKYIRLQAYATGAFGGIAIDDLIVGNDIDRALKNEVLTASESRCM